MHAESRELGGTRHLQQELKAKHLAFSFRRFTPLRGTALAIPQLPKLCSMSQLLESGGSQKVGIWLSSDPKA